MTALLKHDIVVIGSSAGGIETLSELVSHLPEHFDASIFIVQHTSPASNNLLGEILKRASSLHAATAVDGEKIEKRRIYVAPSDHHMLVHDGHVQVVRGPRENRSRPAIDPLFRTAAIHYQSRVIGVILSGMLDDGSAGLLAVQRCGGLTIAQEPEDAAFPDMPRNAIEHVGDVDYILPVRQIPLVLRELIHEPAPPMDEKPPRDIIVEAQFAQQVKSDVPRQEILGELAPVTCPECNGPLWEFNGDQVKRYRCHVGHSYTAKTLLVDQNQALERSIWAAFRVMTERATLLRKMAKTEEEAGRSSTASLFHQQAVETEEHSETLRAFLSEDEDRADSA